MDKPNFVFIIVFSEGRDSQFHRGLKTKGIDTLGLVPVSYKIF